MTDPRATQTKKDCRCATRYASFLKHTLSLYVSTTGINAATWFESLSATGMPSGGTPDIIRACPHQSVSIPSTPFHTGGHQKDSHSSTPPTHPP